MAVAGGAASADDDKGDLRRAVASAATAGDVGEIVVKRRSVRWSPSAAWAGARVSVRGAGFPAKRRVSIRFGRSRFDGTTTRQGTFSVRIEVPAVRRGRHRLRMRAGRLVALIPFTVTREPVVVAAGDIACDPADPNFNDAAGRGASCHMRGTSEAALTAQPDLALTLGDSQYEDATVAKYQASYEPTWGRLKSITRPTPGNHEYETPGAVGYFDYFNGPGRRRGPAGDRAKGYYSFDIGRWHLVALNANCQLPEIACSSRSPQARWLRADLRRTRKRCVLAFAGRPRFSSDDAGTYRPLVDLFRILHGHRVELLLAGDSHNYERFAPQDPAGRLDTRRGVRQFVVGTGGKNLSRFNRPLDPNSEAQNATTFGVLALHLHPRSYSWQFVPEPGGHYTDSGARACR